MFSANCLDLVQLLFPNCLQTINKDTVFVIPFVGEVSPMEVEECVEVVGLDDGENAVDMVDASEMEIAANIEIAPETGNSAGNRNVSAQDIVAGILRVAEAEYAAKMGVDPEDIVGDDSEDAEFIDQEPVPSQALAFVCLDVRTGVVYDIKNGCDCKSPRCQQSFLDEMSAWEHQAREGESINLPEHVVAEPRMSEFPPMMYVPTQQITWNVEQNFVDYDDDALCLCGEFICPMKFQMNKPIGFSGLYTMHFAGDTEEEKMRALELKRKQDDLDEEKTRRYISILERESMQIQLEQMTRQAEYVPGPQYSIPWTLFSGLPFYMMTDVQLMNSYEELELLIKGAEVRAHCLWMQADQSQSFYDQERRPFTILDIFSSLAERAEAKIRHYEQLQAIVNHVMEYRR